MILTEGDIPRIAECTTIEQLSIDSATLTSVTLPNLVTVEDSLDIAGGSTMLTSVSLPKLETVGGPRGPSDTNEPLGPPFPPGNFDVTVTFAVPGVGSLTAQLPIEVLATP